MLIFFNLQEVNNWHFDIFRLHDKSSGHSLKYVAKELFSRYGIVSRFRINLDKLESFLSAVEHGYTKLKNPYHNDIHAADVTQTLHYFIGSTGLANSFTDLEIFSLLFAALIHDFEHTGRTNNFHVNVGTELALLYNDRSVLENHHVSAAFRLLRDEDKSILTNLKPEEFRDFRNLVIEMVLSTDMSTHFGQIKNVRAILNGEKVSSTTTMSLMSLLLHTADISHPGKPWRLHKKFADTILEEFFLQGDEEAKMGLPFSPLCDRNNVLIPESQISFIEFIVEPSLTIMTDLIDLVLNVEDGGPMQINPAPPKTDSNNSGSGSDPKNSDSANANSGNDSSTTTSVANNSDNNSNKNSTTTVSRVPPPVPSRKGQIKPFQNLSSGSSTGTPGRRTESENCIKTVSSSNNNSSEGGNKLPLNSRTPSFPLQSGSHNYGPILRPWFNHLVENKAKWRMISA
ncbi:Calcium/calmodulin-dependent 3',5'-cyclic nucleotide phosphodiesterase 1A, partial [Orchesella cincta]